VAGYLERYAELAKRLTSLSGGEVLTDVAPELVYAIIVEADAPEHKLLMATRLWVARIFLAASAGNFSTCFFTASPGQICVIDSVYALGGTATWGMAPSGDLGAGYGAFQHPTHRDGRARGQPAATFATRQTAAAVLNGAHEQIAGFLPAQQTKLGLVFLNNGLLVPVFETAAVNTALDVTIFGYDRPFDAHEVDATVM
jgi:hypothetical protein